jgi:hypothetical protein
MAVKIIPILPYIKYYKMCGSLSSSLIIIDADAALRDPG